MDWMETVFGLDLDHGDGTFEIALISIAVIIAVLVFVRRRSLPGRHSKSLSAGGRSISP